MDNSELYIKSLKSEFPELGASLDKMSQYIQQKLYYQLSNLLLDFTAIPFFANNGAFFSLYKNALRPLRSKLEPFKLARLAIFLADQTTESEREILLGEIKEAVSPNAEAVFLVEILKLSHCGENLTKQQLPKLEAIWPRLEQNIEKFDPFLFSFYYKTLLYFLKNNGAATDFYKAAIAFLEFDGKKYLNAEEIENFVNDIVLAALSGKIYSFSDLSENLKETNLDWAQKLFQSLDEGDIPLFETIVENTLFKKNEKFVSSKKPFLWKKIRKTKFLKFCRKNIKLSQNKISFGEIETECDLAKNDVELMLIEMICEGLLRGKIDNVDRIFHLKWVLPKEMALSEAKSLAVAVDRWIERIGLLTHPVVDVKKWV